MKLTIYRTGGFAGIRELILSLDTQSLPSATAVKIHESWQPVRARIQAAAQMPAAGADFFKYEIVTHDQSGDEMLELVDDGSETTKVLLDFIAESQKPSK